MLSAGSVVQQALDTMRNAMQRRKAEIVLEWIYFYLWLKPFLVQIFA